MISRLLHSRPDHIAIPALTDLFMLPLANAQTMQPGTGAIKPGMAASAPLGTGNLDMTDMTRGMNEKMAATSQSACAHPRRAVYQSAPYRALIA